MSPTLTDEVWRQLDPNVGRLSRRVTIRVWVAIGLAIALVAAGLAAWESGVVVPQLSWGVYGIAQTSPPSDTLSLDVGITNEGLVALTILAVGASGPGLTLIDRPGPLPSRIAPDATVRVFLTYRITDCAQIPTGSAPVAVRVQRSGGVQTAEPRTFASRDYWRVWTSPWCGSR